MFAIWTCILILAYLRENVLGLSKIYCDLDDSECLTRGAIYSYENAILGTNTDTCSDPLYLNIIEFETKTMKFKLADAKLSGLRNCDVVKVKMVQENQTYIYSTFCKHITIESDYEIKGHINEDFLEGQGRFKSVHDDIEITYVGDYAKPVDEAGVTHMQVTNHTIELVPKGKVTYEFENLFYGDELKSKSLHAKLSSEHWKTLDDVIAFPIMRVFVRKLYDNVNKYMATVPLEELYFYYA